MFDINSLWYGIVQSLLQLIDGINAVFYWLAGIRPASQYPADGVQDVVSSEPNLLSQIFDNKQIFYIFGIFVCIGVMLLGITTAVGFVKTSFGQKDQPESKTKMLGKSVSAGAWVIAMPIIFYVAVLSISGILNVIVQTMSDASGSNENATLGAIIGKACLPTNTKDEALKAFEIGMSYANFKNIFPDGMNYLMAILSSGCVIVGLFISCLTVVERLIHLVFLYVISPFILAKLPLDDGKSFDQWKELTVSKFLGITGIVVCMYLFFLMMPMVNEFFAITPNITEDMHKFALTVAKVVFIIAGVFTFTKAGTLFAHLVSQGAGQFEGMSQGQTTGMLAMGARLAGGAMSKGAQGARMAGGGGMAGGMAGGINSPLNQALNASGRGGDSQAQANPKASIGGIPNSGGASGVGSMASAGGAGAPNVGATAGGGNQAQANQSSPIGDIGSAQNTSARRSGGNGSASTAFLYGGVGGLLGYGAGKVIGAVVKPITTGIRKLSTFLPFVGKKGAGSGGVSLGERVSAGKANRAENRENKNVAKQQKHNAMNAQRTANGQTPKQNFGERRASSMDKMQEKRNSIAEKRNAVSNNLGGDKK